MRMGMGMRNGCALGIGVAGVASTLSDPILSYPIASILHITL